MQKQNWMLRCIRVLVAICLVGALPPASTAAPNETSKASTVDEVPLEYTISAILPDPAAYSSVEAYAASDERAELLRGIAAYAGGVIAPILEDDVFGPTERYDSKQDKFSATAGYTGPGELTTADGNMFVFGEFIDGHMDPSSVSGFRVTNATGERVIIRSPQGEDAPYWNVTHITDAKGTVSSDEMTSLMIGSKNDTSQGARDLDRDAILSMIATMDTKTPGWRSLS